VTEERQSEQKNSKRRRGKSSTRSAVLSCPLPAQQCPACMLRGSVSGRVQVSPVRAINEEGRAPKMRYIHVTSSDAEHKPAVVVPHQPAGDGWPRRSRDEVTQVAAGRMVIQVTLVWRACLSRCRRHARIYAGPRIPDDFTGPSAMLQYFRRHVLPLMAPFHHYRSVSSTRNIPGDIASLCHRAMLYYIVVHAGVCQRLRCYRMSNAFRMKTPRPQHMEATSRRIQKKAGGGAAAGAEIEHGTREKV